MKSLRLDAAIVLAVAALMVLGAVMVYSASAVKADRDMGDASFFFKRQAVFGLAGLAAMFLFSLIPYRFWDRAVIPLLVAVVALLALVLTPLGHTANSATRWFRIGPFSLQVAELAKLVVVMYMARYLARRGEYLRQDHMTLIRPLVILLVITSLIAAEPDLGTAIFVGLIGGLMLFIAGAPMPWPTHRRKALTRPGSSAAGAGRLCRCHRQGRPPGTRAPGSQAPTAAAACQGRGDPG